MEQWGSVFDEWSSYSPDQLDYMSLPQGHPLFIRRENLRQQKRHDEDDEKTQPGEVAQLPETVRDDEKTQPVEVAQLLYEGDQSAVLGRSQAVKAAQRS